MNESTDCIYETRRTVMSFWFLCRLLATRLATTRVGCDDCEYNVPASVYCLISTKAATNKIRTNLDTSIRTLELQQLK